MRALFISPLAGLLAGFTLVQAETLPTDSPQRPMISQYVSPYLDNGTQFSSVMALSPEQMTTAEGENPLFDAITLILPWSKLEPKPGQVDFSVIDQPLEYWAKKGKKIYLNVAPITFPTLLGKSWGGQLTGGTPDWVVQQSDPHTVICRLLYAHTDKHGPFAMPTPWNDNFKKAYFDLVDQLAKKYDGDPRILAVRVGTGTEGEENPIYDDGRKHVYPGYTHALWYGYCRDAIAAYAAAFHHTPLECDLTFAGLAVHETAAGGPEEVQKTIDTLKQYDVTLGFNAWRGTPVDPKANDMIRLLTEYHNSGRPVTLEVGGTFRHKHMWNTANLLATVQLLHPVRLNFMGDTAALVNHAEGINDPRDATSWALCSATIKAQKGDPDLVCRNLLQLIIDCRKVPGVPAETARMAVSPAK